MGLIAPTIPNVGDPRGSEEVDMLNAIITLINLVNGNIDSANIAANVLTANKLVPALCQQLGISNDSSVRRGKSIIATEESRSNTAYGLLTTPDRVSSIVLPTDGLIVVGYQAQWKNSVGGAGRAAIHLGSNAVVAATFGSTSPLATVAEATGPTNADTYKSLSSYQGGVTSHSTGSAYTGDVTTGQVLGSGGSQGYYGACVIFAATGTYDVSVQFKSASGNVTVKERKLWVWSIGF
jgi:hypothetical protein